MTKRIVKNTLFIIGIFIVAAAGMFFGSMIRGVSGTTGIPEVFANVNLPIGSPFPDVEVLTDETVPMRTADLVGNRGAIVLFMELGCPPCEKMTLKWQKAIDDGLIAPTQVVGITFNPPEYISPFYENFHLTFPVYSDTGSVFMNKYNVSGFPYLVAVNTEGNIAGINFDANQSVDEGQIRRWFSATNK